MFETLPDFLQKHPRVRLIIVDSISFHFRQGFVDMGHRMRVLNRVAQDLMALAESTHTAVRHNQIFLNAYSVTYLSHSDRLHESSHEALL